MKRVENDGVRKYQQMVYKKSEGSGRMRVFLVFFFSVLLLFFAYRTFLVVRCPCRDGWERINRRVDEAGDGLRTTDETTGRVKVVARQDNRQRRGIETKFFASTSRSSSW